MTRTRALRFAVLLAAVAAVACTPKPVSETPASQAPSLTGVNWHLVEIRYSDGTTLRPDDPGVYSIAFLPGGAVSVRADCNRGNGMYKAAGPTLKIGPLAVTRAMCPPGSISDRYLQGLDIAASYRFRDGDLLIAMSMDTGILKLTPAK